MQLSLIRTKLFDLQPDQLVADQKQIPLPAPLAASESTAVRHGYMVKRSTARLTKYVVWQRSGVSQSMLSLVEQELQRPTMEIVLRIVDAVDADLPRLIKKAQGKVGKP